MVVYNPNDAALQRDPYPTYEALRNERPVYHNPDLGFWALSRHADVAAVWRDSQGVYSSDHGVTLEQWGPDARRSMSFLAMDPPEHTAVRGLISRAFTPGRVQRLEPRIRELARAYAATAIEQGSFDFITGFAARVPVDVISELIGVPVADRPMLLRLSQQIIERDDLTGQLTAGVRQANLELHTYYRQLIAERRRQPQDDLATALLEAELDGRRLEDADVAATLMLLGVAGNETTIKLIGTAWRLAWTHPNQREQIWTGQIPVRAWAEETLRFEGPSQYTMRRTTRPLDLHGTTIPQDARVLLVIAAANRDDRAFPDADRYDPRRDTSQTLAFGLGPHFCLGASLARLEATVVLEELLSAVEADYDIDPAGIRWAGSPSIRGLVTLPTTVKPRRRRANTAR
ncbi:cytochrome P450 [Nonomuraea endophytica]|uniref:cytochrome P450 n=1 Tax=Nonomuraea endophytica TaxID=714136 RepID=UPI0037C58E74